MDAVRAQDIVARVEAGARVVRTWELTGGLSAVMIAVEVERPDGRSRTLIVRHPRPGDPHFALPLADEFRLLGALHRRGLPVPAPQLFDDTRSIWPEPYVVVDYIDGATRFVTADSDATARGLAEQLVLINDVDGEHPDFAVLPRRTNRVGTYLATPPRELDVSLREDEVRDALRDRWPPEPPVRAALLHGDFWPGNVLWDGDTVRGVVDWEDAAVGDPLADMGVTRLDVLWAYGQSAMEAFTSRYCELRDVDARQLPLWDLVAALRPAGELSLWAQGWDELGRPDVTSTTLRAAHGWFVDQALAAL
jgi:aminoglycoside phosphotransferase (APT) family kinase protein